MTLEEITEWLNSTYPDRDWNQWCQRLVWNVVHVVSETPEARMATYDSATAALHASRIESTDASKAPAGAIHYFKYPADGHVGVGLGGESVLMTGTKAALGKGGVLLGTNYGVTTVSAYSKQMGNPYLGWSRSSGANPSIIGKIGAQPEKGAIAMPALIRTPDGSIGFVSDAGTLDAISSQNEVESLKATGLVGNWVQLPDMNIWNTLAARTARLRAQQSAADPSVLATEIAALMVGPVVSAVADAGGLTQAEVEAAVESVTKRLLGKAAA